MATVATTAPAQGGGTPTTWRAWAQAISDGLTACGFAKTADTGQIDIATVALTGSGTVAYGYEIRAFTGPDQASAPLFVKVHYGSASTAPNLWLTFGTATNGAGTLTGMPSQVARLNPNAASAPAVPLLMSGDGGRFAVTHRPDGAAPLYAFSFERLPGGHVGVVFSHSAAGYNATVRRGAADPSSTVDTLQGPVLFSGSGISGADVRLACGGFFTPTYAPTACWLAYFGTDLADSSVLTVDVGGTPATYRTVNSTTASPFRFADAVTFVGNSPPPNVTARPFAMRWE